MGQGSVKGTARMLQYQPMSTSEIIVIQDAQPTLGELIATITDARQDIARNFLSIGQSLALVKAGRLHESGGFESFQMFLKDQRIAIAPQDAERFMAIAADPTFQKQAALGLSKMLELIKMPTRERQLLLTEGATLQGKHKAVEEMNLSELKRASQSLRREGKSRCDRWVEHVKELDGRFYGSGSNHSCYEYEMEERRTISAGRIPAEQLDTVLDTLRFESVQPKITEDAVPLQWLPESLYQLYGQTLQDRANLSGEVSRDSLQQEQAALKKLVHLCQVRLREIGDTLEVLQELDGDA
jgi:hypothetical protein